jgi:peptidyl-prolyl cis-trans isomerase C
MKLQSRAAAALLLLLAGWCLAACGGSMEHKDDELARVGSVVITPEVLDARIKELPAFSRAEFDGAEGRQRLLKRLVEEEMMYQAALDAGLQNEADVARQLRDSRRRILVDAYYRGFVEKAARLSDDQVQAYYDQHPEEFTDPEQVRIRHILLGSKREAERLRARIVSGDIDFAEAARKYSTDDRSKASGGTIPGYLARDRSVGHLGQLPGLVDAALKLEAGEISQPIQTEKGWHLVLVEEKRASKLRPLSEVREQIQARGSGERIRTKYEETMKGLRERYNVEVNDEALDEARLLSAPELFQLAQETQDPKERIRIYQRILHEHPENDRCFEAQFMIGFVYSEDLKDHEKATEAFQKLIDNYPDCDLVESARWMMANQGQDLPDFEEPQQGG